MEKNFFETYAPYIPETDLYLFNTGAARRAHYLLGCHYIPQLQAHRFAVYAPNARSVSVIGDFNGWTPGVAPMVKSSGGVWFAFVEGLEPGALYKYYLEGYNGEPLYKADPFAFHAETGPQTASRVWDLSGYTWHDERFLKRRAKADVQASPMSVYEVHIGSWRVGKDETFPWYRNVADQLAAYCSQMGYTHVELMPVTEYPFDGSWGYQVTGYYAPTSRYGTPQDFMYFVDTLHAAGIGVLMDWVPAHFPKDAHGLARFDGTAVFEHENPLQGEHPEWGTLIFNYGRPEVISFLVSSVLFFCEYYHIDGIRADAVSSMLYLDYGRENGAYIPNKFGGNINLEAVEFLKTLNTAIAEEYPGVIRIAEESTAYEGVTRPACDGGLGFDFKWDMGFMHDTLYYMSLDHLFRSKNHDKLTFSMLYAYNEHYILPFSHDEVVHGKKSMIDKMFGSYEEKFASLRALYAYQFAHPGKKLTFMGSEFAQFIEWNYKQQLDWFLLEYPAHDAMRAYSKALNHLYTKYPALWQNDRNWEGFSWLNVDDYAESAIAFMRIPDDGKSDCMICALNFTPNPVEGFTIGLPAAGRLTRLLSSDERRFGGTGLPTRRFVDAERTQFANFPYSAKLTLAPLSGVFFKYKPYEKA